MPTPDEDFVRRLQATFRVEAEEHLQSISATLLELEKSTASTPPIALVETIYRQAHSLKGAARAVDFGDIETICQAIEGVFASWKREITSPSQESLDALHIALDSIHALLESPESSAKATRDHLIGRLQQMQAVPPPPALVPAQPPGAQANEPAPPVPPALAPVAINESAALKPAVEIEKAAPSNLQTVRIPFDRLDARLSRAEDMLAVKSIMAQRMADLRDLNAQWVRWRVEWGRVWRDLRSRRHADHQTASTIANLLDRDSDFTRSFESRLNLLSAQAQQDGHSIARRIDELLDDTKRLLMLPFSAITAVFPKIVRDLCREQGKEAELVIQGADIEIDKRILDEMKDALIHVLRNCVDHGIERPAERRRLGKPTRAVVTIAVSALNGNEVEIMVADDGAGIDLHRIKESAVRQGVVTQTEARAMSPADALKLVFCSEVSTSPTVTAISGRGLGMAIVRAQVEKLNGRVSIQSTPKAGTTLRMVLQPTLATFRGIIATAEDQTFVIPVGNVDRVTRIVPKDIHTTENRPCIAVDGRLICVARLHEILDLPGRSKPAEDNKAQPVVILNSGQQRLALVVDQVLRDEEVLVKPLQKPLVWIRNIAAITLLANGKAAPILNVSDLMRSARTASSRPVAQAPQESQRPAVIRKILLVEDSITSRMLLKGILEGAGYQVTTAVDGIDAFTTLREHSFDLVVSDVEMPRMTGLDLAAHIRADAKLRDLPLILVTALESREERERGLTAGANAYIVKSSFEQSNLIEAVRRLVE